jgi:catechol 2,3-dioxygenase-like lactoylglutathione lyase family enzyme
MVILSRSDRALPSSTADAQPGKSVRRGYHHFCLNVASVEGTIVKLRARGVAIVTEPFVLPAISRKLAFFADPFGNLIELAEVLP